jgi:hypothetical protein
VYLSLYPSVVGISLRSLARSPGAVALCQSATSRVVFYTYQTIVQLLRRPLFELLLRSL